MTCLNRLRSPLLALCVAALAWLAGCGPTGGGTGTGESAFAPADFGAKPVSACSSAFASLLSCAAISTVPQDAQLLAGTATMFFVGTAASGPYTLTLQGNRAELQSRCQATRFEGQWGVLPGGDGRYFGGLTGADRGTAQPARLWVQPLAGTPDGLQVLVEDAGAAPVLGPLQLRREVALPTAAPVCP